MRVTLFKYSIPLEYLAVLIRKKLFLTTFTTSFFNFSATHATTCPCERRRCFPLRGMAEKPQQAPRQPGNHRRIKNPTKHKKPHIGQKKSPSKSRGEFILFVSVFRPIGQGGKGSRILQLPIVTSPNHFDLILTLYE